MKKSIVKRVLALAMALSVCASLIVLPARADIKDMVGLGTQVTYTDDKVEILRQMLKMEYENNAQKMLNNAMNMVFKAAMWIPEWNMTVGRSAYDNGSISYVSLNELNSLVTSLNMWQNRGWLEQICLGDVYVKRIDGTDDFGIAIPVNVANTMTGGITGNHSDIFEVHVFWLCDPNVPGNILVGNASVGVEPDAPTVPENDVSTSLNNKGKWFDSSSAFNSRTYRMASYEDLYNKAVELHGHLSLYKGKYYIADYEDENIYCGFDGLPYCAWPKQATVTETIRETDVIIDSQTKVEVNVEGGSDVNLDIDELIATLPDGTNVNADNIIYNDDSKTYYINTSEGNQTEGADGTIYNTYNYAYTYNIDYTSVTYIGQTAEYTKHYEVYYKLPDGRSSADLTAEELEQLNLAVDVLNYGRSADDVSLRSLYHFDGETTDDSYWNYCTDFTWNTGASLTYMDAGNFEGALYLDETAHDFTITLPSNLSNGDFTLQFRYYQSATLAPQTDSYVKFGDQTLLQLNGKEFLDSSGTVLASTPIGTWNEVALIRHSGTLYYYLNGVKIGSVANMMGFGNTIQFIFGSAQQTYKYFDELRVLNFALAESGSSYTPSSVPHDTNLSLVLPTDSKPIADEYWSVTSSKTNLFGFDFEEFVSGVGASYGHGVSQVHTAGVNFPQYFAVDGYGTISTGQYGILLSRTSSYQSITTRIASNDYNWYLTAPISIKLGTFAISNGASSPYTYSNFVTGVSGSSNDVLASYVFSLALSDGSICSVPFEFCATSGDTKEVAFEWGTIYCHMLRRYSNKGYGEHAYYINIVPNDSIDVVYMELCSGTETDLKVEYVSSVTDMTPEQLKTPTLAVRSDVDATSYQIGGVRPSLPKKGMVWALVEGGTITSLQIYNGRAWEECDGRIWTGSRWVSLASYDVKLQKDLSDIVGTATTPDYEYIYTESGFWDWWQKSWNSFTTKFFSTQNPQNPQDPEDSHQHTYVGEILSEVTCTKAGQTKYVCVGCGDSYIEATKPLDHDFEEISDTESGHVEPTGLICSHCASTDISCELSGPVAVCTCNDCLYVWEVQAEYEYGETLYKCRRCGEEKKDTKDDRGLFSLIGSFFADTIRWIVSKLGSLVAALAALAQLFADFIETVISFAGDHPAFFAAALALIPADLMTLIWFSIVSGIIMLVWKKFKG